MSNAAKAAFPASGSVCRYFSVVVMDPWPRRSLTTCKSAPPASSHEACACRSPCGVTRNPRSARRQRRVPHVVSEPIAGHVPIGIGVRNARAPGAVLASGAVHLDRNLIEGGGVGASSYLSAPLEARRSGGAAGRRSPGRKPVLTPSLDQDCERIWEGSSTSSSSTMRRPETAMSPAAGRVSSGPTNGAVSTWANQGRGAPAEASTHTSRGSCRSLPHRGSQCGSRGSWSS